MTSALAREVHALDPNLAPVAAITMQEHVDRGTYTQRLAVTLLAIFGGTALLLAAIGLYAVMSYAVSQSTRELALRMALGASVSDLLRLVLSRGTCIDRGRFDFGRGRCVRADASPRQPALSGKSPRSHCVRLGRYRHDNRRAFACLLPARRATRIDPARALRAMSRHHHGSSPMLPAFPCAGVRRGVSL